jgi:uncharacterized protein (TIGR02145 family)
MKKPCLLIIIVFLIIFSSCSTSSDTDENQTIIPTTPNNLSGTKLTNQIKLTWTDNSTNEAGFKIERKTGNGNWTQISTVGSNITEYTDIELSVGIQYSYRIFSYNNAGNSESYSNIYSTTIFVTIPVLTTSAVGSISQSSASSGGIVSYDGGSNITDKGIVWSSSQSFQITYSTNDGSGSGSFASNMTGLIANTTYYAKSYATNGAGTAYGNVITFTTLAYTTAYSFTQGANLVDIDGNSYPTIVTNCNNQTWIQKNLNTSKYSDGTIIPQVSDLSTWQQATTGAWCYYANNSTNGITYGKMYNWYAVAGIHNAASATNPALRKKLAPTGWHIPNNSEWQAFIGCLGGESVAGGKMKSTGTSLWQAPNTDASNSSGFTGLPGGQRFINGSFQNLGVITRWLSSDEFNSEYTWFVGAGYGAGGTGLGYLQKNIGYSVRCIKD